MILKLYSIRDEVASSSEIIMTAPNDGLLRRQIKMALQDKSDNYIKANYQDKRVYFIGEFDTSLGLITSHELSSNFICSVEEVLIELIAEIKKHKELVGQTDESEA